MYLDSSLGLNNKTINVTSKNLAIGMFAVGKNGSAVNNKKITVDSQKDGYGMAAGYGAVAKNNGTINIKNQEPNLFPPLCLIGGHQYLSNEQCSSECAV